MFQFEIFSTDMSPSKIGAKLLQTAFANQSRGAPRNFLPVNQGAAPSPAGCASYFKLIFIHCKKKTHELLNKLNLNEASHNYLTLYKTILLLKEFNAW